MAGGGGGGGVVERPWVTVGAIRSTGLTAALGIARHVGRLSYPNHYLTLALTLTLAPALTLTLALALTLTLTLTLTVCRLCSAALPPPSAARRPLLTTPLPEIAEIVASYHARGDGSVVFGDGAMGFGAHYVTHPLTRAGFERLAASATFTNYGLN